MFTSEQAAAVFWNKCIFWGKRLLLSTADNFRQYLTIFIFGVYLVYLLIPVSFFCGLVAPSPTYGVSGLPQALFCFVFRRAVLKKVRVCQCVSFVVNILTIFLNSCQFTVPRIYLPYGTAYLPTVWYCVYWEGTHRNIRQSSTDWTKTQHVL